MKRLVKLIKLLPSFFILLPLYLQSRPPDAYNHTSWYAGMVAADYDGDGRDEIAFDYGVQGIWIYDSNASPHWFKISNSNPRWMVAARILQSSHYELVVGLAGHSEWWNYEQTGGYPGAWTRLYEAYALHAYTVDVDGENIDEIQMFFDTLGVVVMDYTGSGASGGFEAHWLEPIGWPGFAVRFGGGDEELVHSFGIYGLKYWDYRAGWPATWTRFSWNVLDDQSMGVDLDSDPEEEFWGDFSSNGTWIFNFSEYAWSRVNWGDLDCAWAVAYDQLAADYEILAAYNNIGSLWMYDGSEASWTRVNWQKPDFILGANVLTASQGGNNGEEAIGDFGSLGIWIQKEYNGSWERINWNSAESLIKAQIDEDPEYEVVFDFGSLGVWTWDAASDAWDRINWSSPEKV